MHTTNLRKVGGSVMLAVPPAILDQLRLKAGATVGLAVDGERLILQPQTGPRYTLDELLAQCDFSQPLSPEDRGREEREWLDAPPVGRELI
jgi:antitoxin ChpS